MFRDWGWSGFPLLRPNWGFPKIKGTILGVAIMRINLFRDLYWVSYSLYHIPNDPKRTPAGPC